MSRSLRIGIVIDGIEERTGPSGAEITNGGVGVYIYNLVRCLSRIDRRNEYVLIRYGASSLGLGAEADGRMRTVTLPRTPFHRYARWIDVPYRAIARSHGLDLVHYPNQFGGAFLPKPPRRVVTLHDLTPLLFPRHHPWRSVVGYRVLLARSLRAADRVIVDSESTRADVVKRGLAPAERVTAIPLGVGEAFRRETRPTGGLGRYDLPDRFLLNVGVLEPRKNHRLLFEALRSLREQGEGIGLVLVGRDGWGWKDPRNERAFADLVPHVRVFRNVPEEDLVALYARAEAFVYPSLYEGFGLPVVEAMACGTPVVTSDRSSLPEVAGEAALLADPDDAASFARQILRLCREEGLRERLVAAGRERVAGLSWDSTAERTLAVYETVCAAD